MNKIFAMQKTIYRATVPPFLLPLKGVQLVFVVDAADYDVDAMSCAYIGTIKQASRQIIHPAVGPIVCQTSEADAVQLLFNTHCQFLKDAGFIPTGPFSIVVRDN